MKRIWLIILVMGFMVQGFTHTISWGQDKRLTYNDSISWKPKVAINNNIVHVVWWDTRGYPLSSQLPDCIGRLFYKRSTNNGVTWSADQYISYPYSCPINIGLAVSGSDVHVVWSGIAYPWDSIVRIYYIHSSNNGNTWSSPARCLSNDSWTTYPSIAVYGSKVHVVYRGWDYTKIPQTTYIKYIGSQNAGATWGTGTQITPDSTPVGYPDIAAYGSNIYVTWALNLGLPHYLIYAYSNNGIDWSYGPIVDNSIGGQGLIYDPSIVANGSKVHIVWVMQDPERRIYYKCYNGVNWSDNIVLVDQINWGANNPKIAISSSGLMLNIVWQEGNSGYGGEIYSKFSTNGGTSWKPATCLSNDSIIDKTEDPYIAISNSYAHLVWRDFRDGEWPINCYGEIYYKRGYLLNEILPIYGVMGRDGEGQVTFCVYPNPFINYAIVPNHESDNFMIYDISGRLLATYHGNRIGEDLAPGIYFLKSQNSKPIRIVKVK